MSTISQMPGARVCSRMSRGSSWPCRAVGEAATMLPSAASAFRRLTLVDHARSMDPKATSWMEWAECARLEGGTERASEGRKSVFSPPAGTDFHWTVYDCEPGDIRLEVTGR